MKTELGKIANMVQSAQQTATPLEKKLEVFSKRLIQITVVLVVIIFIIGWQMGQDLMQVLNTSIALAVAAIPEGIPIVATLGLARGMLNMARYKFLGLNLDYSIARAKAELGYDPSTTFESGMQKTMQWLRDEGHIKAKAKAKR